MLKGFASVTSKMNDPSLWLRRGAEMSRRDSASSARGGLLASAGKGGTPAGFRGRALTCTGRSRQRARSPWWGRSRAPRDGQSGAARDPLPQPERACWERWRGCLPSRAWQSRAERKGTTESQGEYRRQIQPFGAGFPNSPGFAPAPPHAARQGPVEPNSARGGGERQASWGV